MVSYSFEFCWLELSIENPSHFCVLNFCSKYFVLKMMAEA